VVYWCDRGGKKKDGFWKSAREWQSEIGIHKYQLDTVTKKIVNAGILNKPTLVRIGKSYTRFYKLNEDYLMGIIQEMLKGMPHTLTSLTVGFPHVPKSASEKEFTSRNQQVKQVSRAETSKYHRVPSSKSTKSSKTTVSPEVDTVDLKFRSSSGKEKSKSKPKSVSGLRESFAPMTLKEFRPAWRNVMSKHYPDRPQNLISQEQGMVKGYLKFCKENNIGSILLMEWAVTNWDHLKTKILFNGPGKNPKPQLRSNPTVFELCAKKDRILDAYYEHQAEHKTEGKRRRKAKERGLALVAEMAAPKEIKPRWRDVEGED
jgi:hypothetical protein